MTTPAGVPSSSARTQPLVLAPASVPSNTHLGSHAGGPSASAATASCEVMLAAGEMLDLDELDEPSLKRLRRKQNNRESARRSRQRKQLEMEALALTVLQHRQDIAAWQATATQLQDALHKLVEQVKSLGGQVDADELSVALPIVSDHGLSDAAVDQMAGQQTSIAGALTALSSLNASEPRPSKAPQDQEK
jgi:bZIP transcription factor